MRASFKAVEERPNAYILHFKNESLEQFCRTPKYETQPFPFILKIFKLAMLKNHSDVRLLTNCYRPEKYMPENKHLYETGLF